MLLLLSALLSPVDAALPDTTLTALRQGNCPVVLETLAETTGLEAAMARASCGDASTLATQLDDGGVLEPYARLLVARQLVDEDPAQTVTILEGVSLPGDAGLEIRLLRGRALISQGRSLDARPDLRLLLNTSVSAEARYWLAWGAETRGDTSAAIETYRAVWSRNATSPFADRSAERLQALGSAIPDYQTADGRALALARARALVKAFRAPEAIPLYDGITAVTQDSSAEWTYELAFALFKAKDYPRSMAMMAKLEPTIGGVKGGSDTLYHYALGMSRTGDYDKAAEYYAELVRQYPGTRDADTSSFKLGYLDFDAGELPTAIDKLEEHLRRYPSSKHADEALWFIGWSHYRLADYDKSEAALDRLLRRYGSSALAPNALYWKARIRGQSGDAAGETAALESLLSRYPVSGHAWFAAWRLDRRFEGSALPEIPEVPQSFIDSQPRMQEALALAEAGQWTWAQERMLDVVPAAKAAGKETALAVAHALVSVGAYKPAQSLARPWCGKPWKPGDLVATTVCYPRPEFSVVESAAAESGLNPLLPYAIMTAESALDPSVTSPAGARGLMQLMPEVAEGVHHQVLGPDAPFDANRLYVAGYNAWLGTTELGNLYTRFKPGAVQPALPLAIGGYNGGADSVQRWLDDYAEPPELDWYAENIGYSETRRYTRRVLGYLMGYRWLYGDPVSGSPAPSGAPPAAAPGDPAAPAPQD